MSFVTPELPHIQALSRALDVLLPAFGILNERVVSPLPPRFCEALRCTDFLLSLSDEEVGRCEQEGLAPRLPFLREAPPALVELGAGVTEIMQSPEAFLPPRAREAWTTSASTNIKARKREQLEVLLSAIEPMALLASRIVDVGAGSGHLSRLAASRFDRDVLGLDRDEARVSFATELALASRASFVVRDAFVEPLALEKGDLAIGLHACGGLGDKLIVEAREARAMVALVSCCLQKIEHEARTPLSSLARARGFVVPRDVLGLSNQTSRIVGVEASLAEMLEARRVRYGLLSLLRGRGLALDPGEEMRGINRRRAHAGLSVLAQMACEKRGLSAPTQAEVEEHDERARRDFARIRRFSLPRAMLARALEIAVILDRAVALEEGGYSVRVACVFEPETTPRNLGIFAHSR